MRARFEALRPRVPDAGFGLIEVMISLVVASIVLSAVAAGVVMGVKATTLSRINQQAGDVLDATIEQARAASYDSLAISSSDPNLSVANDSRLVTSGCPNSGTMCIRVPNQTGSGTMLENLVTTSATGYVTNHVKAVTAKTNKVTFSVYTYITKPSDETNASYKRVTAFVTWKEYGSSHSREASTYVTSTRRGLPLPHFKLTPVTATSRTVNPGTRVYFGFKLTNLGAPDAFDFTASDESLGWSYYVDNGDGSFDPSNPAAETAMADSDGNGVRDTGLMNANVFVIVWVIRTVPSSAPTGTSTVTFKAQSVAQPSLGAGVSSLTQNTSVIVQNGVITPSPTATPTSTPTTSPCTPVGTAASSGTLYYLHNTSDGTASTGADTAAQYPMTFSSDSPGAGSLGDYSTGDGYSSVTGRVLKPVTASNSVSTADQVADFRYQVTAPGGTTYGGTASVTLWVEPASGLSSDPVNFQVYIVRRAVNGNNTTLTTMATVASSNTTWGCNGFNQISVQLPVADVKVNKNDYVDVLVEDTGTNDLRVGYDTTSMNASVILPVTG